MTYIMVQRRSITYLVHIGIDLTNLHRISVNEKLYNIVVYSYKVVYMIV